MKTLLASVLGLTAMTSVALAGEPVYLTGSQMDGVTAGQASASLSITNIQASGPTSATASASDIAVTAATVGGLSPSNIATVTGTFSATSE
jgi:hypothetical protein